MVLFSGIFKSYSSWKGAKLLRPQPTPKFLHLPGSSLPSLNIIRQCMECLPLQTQPCKVEWAWQRKKLSIWDPKIAQTSPWAQVGLMLHGRNINNYKTSWSWILRHRQRQTPCAPGVAAVRELSLAAQRITKNKWKIPVSLSLPVGVNYT